MSGNLNNNLKSNVDIIAYPFGYAAGKESAGYTPELIEYLCKDVFVEKGLVNEWITTEVPRDIIREKYIKNSNKIRNEADVHRAVECLAVNVATALWNGRNPLVLGGDHSQGTATAKATMLVEVLKCVQQMENDVLPFDVKKQIIDFANKGDFILASKLVEKQYLASKNEAFKNLIDETLDKTAIVWLDSHGDYNNPKISGSGNYHGQSLRAVVRSNELGDDKVGSLSGIFGEFLKASPKNVYVIGHRDLDEDEIVAMTKDGVNFLEYGLTSYGNKDISIEFDTAKVKNDKKFSEVVNKLINALEEQGYKVHLSCDTDVIDGRFVIGTGTPQGVDVGRKIPVSGLKITREMVRENFVKESPAGPLPSEVYAAVNGSARTRATDNTEISGILTIEHENGSKTYQVDYSGIVVGIKSIVSMLASEGTKLKGKNGLFREIGLAIADKFNIDKNPECWESGKFSIKPLIDAYYKPIIEKMYERDRAAGRLL